MSVKRYAAKRDSNEREIVKVLTACGASVAKLSDKGLPDLLIGWQGRTILAETKTKRGKLTDAQREFIDSWQGAEIAVIRSVEDALALIGAAA